MTKAALNSRCEHCGAVYFRGSPTSRYCSHACRWWNSRIHCPHCGRFMFRDERCERCVALRHRVAA